MGVFAAPSLGLLELESLARGVVVADALVKKAAVQLSIAEAVSPGKYLLVFTGAVAEVDEAFQAGVEAGGAMILDRLLLPHVAEAVVEALQGRFQAAAHAAVGIVETHTVAATLLAADQALKHAAVTLTSLQLARGIGGKGWFTISGVQHDVEAALEAVARAVAPPSLVATELIQRPHPELRGTVLR
jgi:microcompartment protein CcmL/EutN